MPWEFKSPHPHCLSRLIHTSAQEPQTWLCPSVTMGTRASQAMAPMAGHWQGEPASADWHVPIATRTWRNDDQHPGQWVPMVTSALPKQPHHTTPIGASPAWLTTAVQGCKPRRQGSVDVLSQTLQGFTYGTFRSGPGIQGMVSCVLRGGQADAGASKNASNWALTVSMWCG